MSIAATRPTSVSPSNMPQASLWGSCARLGAGGRRRPDEMLLVGPDLQRDQCVHGATCNGP